MFDITMPISVAVIAMIVQMLRHQREHQPVFRVRKSFRYWSPRISASYLIRVIRATCHAIALAEADPRSKP
jgi:hypothetical protein